MNPSIHPILRPLAAIALTLVAFPGPAAAAPPPRTLAITGKYLLLPVSNINPRRSRLQVKVDDVLIHTK